MLQTEFFNSYTCAKGISICMPKSGLAYRKTPQSIGKKGIIEISLKAWHVPKGSNHFHFEKNPFRFEKIKSQKQMNITR